MIRALAPTLKIDVPDNLDERKRLALDRCGYIMMYACKRFVTLKPILAATASIFMRFETQAEERAG